MTVNRFPVTQRSHLAAYLPSVVRPPATILTLGLMLGGTVIVENIFAIPGLGRHYVTSIQNLDYSLILGLTIFFAIFLIVMNLIVDIIYGIIDPRIKVQ